MNLELIFKVGNVVAWLLAATAFYFTNQTDAALGTAQVNERVSVLEQSVHQEVLGYSVLQSSIGIRLDRIERKVDCLIDNRLCH